MSNRSSIIYGIILWGIINLTLMSLMLPEDFMDLNNWIELGLWTSSIFALLSNKKWGIAFTIFTLIYTLSTSVGIIIYYQICCSSYPPVRGYRPCHSLFHSQPMPSVNSQLICIGYIVPLKGQMIPRPV